MTDRPNDPPHSPPHSRPHSMTRAMQSPAVWSLPAALLLCACTVGTDYHPPPVSVPPAFSGTRSSAGLASDTRTRSEIRPKSVAGAASDAASKSAGDIDLSSWWRQFNDPTLSCLIDRALADSLTLKAAVSRIREARLKEIEVGAAAYPGISATGSALRLHTNGGLGNAIPPQLTSYSAGFDASWEIDLFGATRRAVEQASAEAEAQVWSRRDGEVSLTAEIANDYLSLRVFQARIAVGSTELARQQDVFALVGARRRAGFITALDVNQQSTLVATTAAQLPQLRAEARARIHALGVLLGEPPEALESELAVPTAAAAVGMEGNPGTLSATGVVGAAGAVSAAGGAGTVAGEGPARSAISSPWPALSLGIPADLVLRRPDIRRAERELAASTAAVGVKQASLYPKLKLYGLPLFAGMSLGDLFSHKNLVLAALGMASVPILDAGRSRAAIGEAEEQRQQAELAYRLVILGALRDVEDAAVRLDAERMRSGSLIEAVHAAANSLIIAQDQYRAGSVTFVNVLQAQFAVLGAQDQLTVSQGLVMTDLVAAYKALGGGWSP